MFSRQKKMLPLLLGPICVALLATACEPHDEYYAREDFARIKKLDAHTHLNTLDTTLIEQAIADNFELCTASQFAPRR
jgi:hypothetical protein